MECGGGLSGWAGVDLQVKVPNTGGRLILASRGVWSSCDKISRVSNTVRSWSTEVRLHTIIGNPSSPGHQPRYFSLCRRAGYSTECRVLSRTCFVVFAGVPAPSAGPDHTVRAAQGRHLHHCAGSAAAQQNHLCRGGWHAHRLAETAVQQVRICVVVLQPASLRSGRRL